MKLLELPHCNSLDLLFFWVPSLLLLLLLLLG